MSYGFCFLIQRKCFTKKLFSKEFSNWKAQVVQQIIKDNRVTQSVEWAIFDADNISKFISYVALDNFNIMDLIQKFVITDLTIDSSIFIGKTCIDGSYLLSKVGQNAVEKMNVALASVFDYYKFGFWIYFLKGSKRTPLITIEHTSKISPPIKIFPNCILIYTAKK